MVISFCASCGRWLYLLKNSLIQYRLVTLAIWFVVTQFWILQCFALLCLSYWSNADPFRDDRQNGTSSSFANDRFNPELGAENDDYAPLKRENISSTMWAWPVFLSWAKLFTVIWVSIAVAFIQLLLVLIRFSQASVRRRGESYLFCFIFL